MRKPPHVKPPKWTGAFLVAVCCFLLGFLLPIGGCGSGATPQPTHTDYLAHIEPVRWSVPEILYRVSGPTGDARRAVRRGFGRWENAMQGYLVLREAQDGEKEHISARFANLVPFFGRGKVERVTPTYASPGVMASATVEFDNSLAIPLRLGELERYASHAAGHFLFAQGRKTGGHSPDPSDVMYNPPGVARPSSADERTFRLILAGAE